VGYIHGRVETQDGRVYEGPLRWGTEESFWDDIFNATKKHNKNLSYLDRREREELGWQHWSGWDFLGINHDFAGHVFAVRFGDMKRIDVHGGDDLSVEFRNGKSLTLGGGSNDVGAEITVADPEHGTIDLKWNRIRTIEFSDTPARLPVKLGEPLYGTVTSRKYEYTGRIQWDHDECLTIDKLDGESSHGKESIPFAEIAAIRKVRDGALVRLKSGSELHLRGTNDVNHGNRGVVVIVPRIGTIKIGWNDFEEVVFEPAPSSGRGYSDYARGRDLVGQVVTHEGRHAGRIVFDLDETWDFEILHGSNGDTEYLIPFRNIARIVPRGQRSDVTLKMGWTFQLRGSQDVTRTNDGLLVFTGAAEPRYIAWRDVDDVRFDDRTGR
jgi:hypothetical protein